MASLGSGTQGAADPTALADITQRIERLEQQVSALRDAGATTPATGNENSAELTQALADLKAKFQAGVAYKEELDRIAVYVPQNADLADLSPYAAAGLANAPALASALDALVPSLAGTGGASAESGDTGGFWAWVGTVVVCRAAVLELGSGPSNRARNGCRWIRCVIR